MFTDLDDPRNPRPPRNTNDLVEGGAILGSTARRNTPQWI
jgi:hypothetical protein